MDRHYLERKGSIGAVLLCMAFFIFGQSLLAQTQITNLPTIYIETENGVAINSKTDYVPARIIIKSSDPAEELNVVTEIRGRGNSTWGMAKKPYRIKLDKKHNLLNLPANAKSWTLLANHADKTLMRNAVAFKISELLGLDFTPSARFVDLVINGKEMGNYMVSDQIQVDKNRVNVDELTAKDTEDDLITGGYLLEVDGFAASEPLWFATTRGVQITIKSPDDEDYNTKQVQYISNYIQDFENRLFSADFKDPEKGYRAKLDTASFINWYIGCELTGNPDSFWSTYIYKKRGVDKLFFGPMWDYDIAFNNDNRIGDALEKLMCDYGYYRTWINQIKKDEWFWTAVHRRWQELLNEGLEEKIIDYISETAILINQSQQRNFSRELWNVLNQRVYLELYLFNSYSSGVEYLKDYVSERIYFLTQTFESYIPEQPSVAFVGDDNFYYAISSVQNNNRIAVLNKSTSEEASIVLWTPQEGDVGQYWSFVKNETDDSYYIMNKNSGLVITGNGHGRNLTQQRLNSSNRSQRWNIIPINTGNMYAIQNVSSQYVFDNSGENPNNGNPILEYTSNLNWNGEYYELSNKNRQWYIQKVEQKNPTAIREIHPGMLKVYPNPAVDYLTVETATGMESGSFSVTLYNTSAQRVAEQYSISGNSVTMTTSHLSPGIYFLVVTTEDGNRIATKVTINR